MTLSVFTELLIWGGIPALSLGIIYYVFTSILKLKIIPVLSQKQGFTILLSIITGTIIIILIVSDTSPSEIIVTGEVKGEKLDALDSVTVYAKFSRNGVPDSTQKVVTTGDGKYSLSFIDIEVAIIAQVYLSHPRYQDSSFTVDNLAPSMRSFPLGMSKLRLKNVVTMEAEPIINPDDVDPVTHTTFRITGISNDLSIRIAALVHSKNKQFKYSSASSNVIQFGHSTGIKDAGTDGNKTFYDGHVVITIGKKQCQSYENLILPSQGFTGDIESEINQKLNDLITTLITEELESIANSIEECL